jgi:hypothetical protein
MRVLDRNKLLEFMGNRKEGLYHQVTRDFAGGLEGRLHSHNEVKYWYEAVERGEFDTIIEEVYVILSATHPEIADFTFYNDRDSAMERVEYLNKLAKREEYWYITLYKNSRNL